jgi:hypothetical protein
MLRFWPGCFPSFKFSVFDALQKHDIIKKRLDFHGNVIEARQDGIGAPKVGIQFCLNFLC